MGGKLGTVGCGRKKEIKNNLNFIKKTYMGYGLIAGVNLAVSPCWLLL
jgi:hypothetical protein